mgnify:CR=1 FL=1
MDRREFGRSGERAAERVLRRAGLIILARNWRASGGELDLAALEGETLVFVEVKSREGGFDAAHPPVSRHQRHLPFRFDLITVAGDPRHPRAITWNHRFHRSQESK